MTWVLSFFLWWYITDTLLIHCRVEFLLWFLLLFPYNCKVILYRWNIVDTVTVVNNIYEKVYTIIRFVDEFGICILSFFICQHIQSKFWGVIYCLIHFCWVCIRCQNPVVTDKSGNGSNWLKTTVEWIWTKWKFMLRSEFWLLGVERIKILWTS